MITYIFQIKQNCLSYILVAPKLDPSKAFGFGFDAVQCGINEYVVFIIMSIIFSGVSHEEREKVQIIVIFRPCFCLYLTAVMVMKEEMTCNKGRWTLTGVTVRLPYGSQSAQLPLNIFEDARYWHKVAHGKS